MNLKPPFTELAPLNYPAELPVSAAREEIKAAIAAHQVVVIAGETGSGKTTQIPKICLELGRGVSGMIGHTQPRRIAARAVAARLAEELGTQVGAWVGFKIRFHDQVHSSSYVKLMTDGILLAEIQRDRQLRAYDTIIIDEAHERSLNIDFLLGYLKQLLPRRRDLKLIITSATINTARFADYFNGAPVLEVSGRTYPVEVRYRPPSLSVEEGDAGVEALPEAIVFAVHELAREDPLGDILIFLAGERDIREVSERLRHESLPHTELLPLFSRLSAAEQDRVFRPHRGRRIVLATNVAETSLTVPGIRFVIDSGLARISRYSHRTKVQRLPIEPVSQAAANQRSGRCGRVMAGVAIRLYSEEDFQRRDPYTLPEIQRTNLASVILQLVGLGLGDIERFPFPDPPDPRYIRDGFRLLHELGALDKRQQLTPLGRQLIQFPIDPRLARMLIAAAAEGALTEVVVIVAALELQDPRERPLDKQQRADELHRRFHHPQSDFLTLVNLWDYYNQQRLALSQNKLRKLCQQEFLSSMRLREWFDIHQQLQRQLKQMGLVFNSSAADYAAVHRALLSGLLGGIAQKERESGKEGDTAGRKGAAERGRGPIFYLGARAIRMTLFPGSAVAKARPDWIVAAERVETSRLFARTVAAIEPEWLEQLAPHLLKRSYHDPHWERRRGAVVASEQVTLYGLVIIADRKLRYDSIDAALCRDLFIKHALVAQEINVDAPFLQHNAAQLAAVEKLEAKSRRRDLLVEEAVIEAFYQARIPPQVTSTGSFEKWREEAEAAAPEILFFPKEMLLSGEAETTLQGLPDQLHLGEITLALRYHFEPGSEDDGVTALVPLALLAQLQPEPFAWLVPGLLQEKLVALIKGLPKSLRRNFVPAINFAEAVAAEIAPDKGDLLPQLSHQLLRMTGVNLPLAEWQAVSLPDHLQFNFRVVNSAGEVLAEGRDLPQLQQQCHVALTHHINESQGAESWQRQVSDWDFAELPRQVALRRGKQQVIAYPALVADSKAAAAGDSGCALQLFSDATAAATAMVAGVAQLFRQRHRDKVRYLQRLIGQERELQLLYSSLGDGNALAAEVVTQAVTRALALTPENLPRQQIAYAALESAALSRFLPLGQEIIATATKALQCYHPLRQRLAAPPAAWQANYVDMTQQLARLVYPGFIAAGGAEWFARLPLYLQALTLRLDKLAVRGANDGLWMGQVAQLEQPLFAALSAAPQRTDLQEARWLLEELRLSLYAQELKSSRPVSLQRLQKRWQVLGI
ncbi:MAG: ATP-dependent RNA helicase HrpA [Gammaproteobacteria bacterium]|nr:ATP-dependent RNA helicase HrpA [Gammaproteobacteria bacterium]